LERIRGAFTAAPTKDEPVNHIPHAAPITDNPKPNATPKFANPYGLICVNTSDQPALQYSELQTLAVDILDIYLSWYNSFYLVSICMGEFICSSTSGMTVEECEVHIYK
jgi:hypothetical protein